MSNRSLSTVLDRFLDPFTECLTPDVARRIVALRADPELQTHLDELADKASEGQLSEAEEAEYRTHVEAIDLITVLQAKARGFLGKQKSP